MRLALAVAPHCRYSAVSAGAVAVPPSMASMRWWRSRAGLGVLEMVPDAMRLVVPRRGSTRRSFARPHCALGAARERGQYQHGARFLQEWAEVHWNPAPWRILRWRTVAWRSAGRRQRMASRSAAFFQLRVGGRPDVCNEIDRAPSGRALRESDTQFATGSSRACTLHT